MQRTEGKGHLLLIFIDGVGLGRPDPRVNPLVGAPILGNFLPDDWQPPPGGGRPARLPDPERPEPVPFGGVVRAVDASLGVPGLPQSATGQTTLFTGVNAALVLGHHHYGFPGPRLRRLLEERSILKQVAAAGRTAAFLNAYTPVFFDLGEKVWERSMSASSWNNRAAGLPFLSFEDRREGRAVFHDITGRTAREKGLDTPLLSPAEAGRVLAEAASAYDFSIYEFFLTDRVGHTGDLDRALSIVAELETFLAAALTATNLETSHVILTSDHGNMEDMSVKSHTHHPVPVLAWGPRAAGLAELLGRLEDFCGVLVEEVTGSPGLPPR
jgi:2,3-bisphosphoglycerate-independent phosphoglycerate mutase